VHSAVLLLIDLFSKYEHYLNDPTRTKDEMWRTIAREINAKGYNITPEMASKKWDNLKTRYVIVSALHCCSQPEKKKKKLNMI
jgi:hypothetical protein